MISSLRGRLQSIGAGWAIIDVNGVGYQVFMPTSTLSSMGRLGKEAFVYTNLVVREDSLSIYGFSSEEELELFHLLLSVSGIGPKLGLSILSAMNVGQVSAAIASRDTDLLKTIPGIGKKTAERLVLELKDKVAEGLTLGVAAQVGPENGDVIAALTSLGYSPAEAGKTVASLNLTEKMSLEEKVRLALQYFGGK